MIVKSTTCIHISR